MVEFRKRPFAVTIVAWLYIAVGLIGFIAHFRESMASWHEGIWIELTEVLALLGGVFLLRGRNWARWLAVAWIAFHVVLSVGQPGPLAAHAALCALFAWILFRPESAQYFRRAREQC